MTKRSCADDAGSTISEACFHTSEIGVVRLIIIALRLDVLPAGTLQM